MSVRGVRLRRVRPADARAAVWALRASRRVRRGVATRGLDAVSDVPTPPALPRQSRRGVESVLHRTGATCLIRAAVLQAWDAHHDRPRDLVIGVTRPGDGFRAHAWLDGEAPCHDHGYVELLRRAARVG